MDRIIVFTQANEHLSMHYLIMVCVHTQFYIHKRDMLNMYALIYEIGMHNTVSILYSKSIIILVKCYADNYRCSLNGNNDSIVKSKYI